MLFLPFLFACTADRDPAESDPPWDRETEPVSVESLACDACESDCRYERVTYDGRFHTTADVRYADPPPAAGPHAYCWLDRGVYEEGVVSDERWIHNLEHGDIVLLWDCPDGCDAEVAEWVAAAGALGDAFVITENEELPTRFAIIAWEHRLLIDCVDTDALGTFYAAHVGRGPESNMAAQPAPDECDSPYE